MMKRSWQAHIGTGDSVYIACYMYMREPVWVMHKHLNHFTPFFVVICGEDHYKSFSLTYSSEIHCHYFMQVVTVTTQFLQSF